MSLWEWDTRACVHSRNWRNLHVVVIVVVVVVDDDVEVTINIVTSDGETDGREELKTDLSFSPLS